MENTKINQETLKLQDLNKSCTKCGLIKPATLEFFYSNKRGKFGLTPRCKPCVNEDNAEQHQRRLSENPDRIRAQANARAKRSYHKDLDKNRKKQREHQAKVRSDPEKLAKIQARKRANGAGLSVKEIENIKIVQNNLCAICSDPNPSDLDHCHKTGKVRWLLCSNCNRGLGGFQDNSQLLRKAADLLDAQK